jgi:hypothetical protein
MSKGEKYVIRAGKRYVPCDIVRRHLHLHSIPYGQTNKPFSHLSRDIAKYKIVVGKLDAKHYSREYSGDFPSTTIELSVGM